MTDKKKTEELNETELDQVTGGASGKGLLAHELTHVQQQSGSKVAFAGSGNPEGATAVQYNPEGITRTIST